MTETDLNKILSSMKQAAIMAGDLTRNANPEERMDIGYDNDMVTIVDLEAERVIRRMFTENHPDIVMLSEEACKEDENFNPDNLADFTGFLVDPIDGSVNFSRNLSPNYGNFAVSIAYCENGIPVAGVIYKPLEDEMFFATKGQGAFLNDLPISVSDVVNINKACVEVGSFWLREHTDLFNRWFNDITLDVNQVLIRGSAAAALADLAQGRIEIMLHSRLNPWDYAAGWILIEEAGGIVMDGDTTPLTLGSRFIYATNELLNDQIRDIILSCPPDY